jgi:hypothetical protein
VKIQGTLLRAVLRAVGKNDKRFPLPIEIAGGRIQAVEASLAFHVRVETGQAPDGAPLRLDRSWLGNLAQSAGKKHAVEITRDGDKRARAVVAGTTYGGHLSGAENPCWQPLDADKRTSRVLSPADWSKGGAIAAVLPTASRDETRQHLCGVHLDAIVTATDGHKLSQRTPVASEAMTGLNVLLPSDIAKGVLAIVAETAPAHLHWLDDGAFVEIHGTCATCAWTVGFKRPDVQAPEYGKVLGMVNDLPHAVAVSAADLATLWEPFGPDATIAVMPGGALVVYDRDPEHGIGTSAVTFPSGTPLFAYRASNLKPLLRSLKKLGGSVTIRHGGPKDPTAIGGEIVMPYVQETLPDHVLADLGFAFGEVEDDVAKAA